MPQRHLTDKTDKRHRIPVDKKAGKAREEKLVKLVTDFGNVLEKLKLFTCKWTCPHCGKVHERDVKAAINIKRQDIVQLRAAGLTVLRKQLVVARAKPVERVRPGTSG